MSPLICTPAYGGQVTTEYMASVMRLQRLAPVELYFRFDSHIDRARNDCVAHFLGTDCSHLVFVDADIGFEPVAFSRLFAHDICGGVYPIKHEGAGFPIDLGAIGPVDANGYAECNELPTGFLSIHRSVFAKVDPRTAFDSMRDDDGTFLTEDYAFCRRAQAAGFKIYADVRSNLRHVGTKTYRGDFAAAVRKEAA